MSVTKQVGYLLKCQNRPPKDPNTFFACSGLNLLRNLGLFAKMGLGLMITRFHSIQCHNLGKLMRRWQGARSLPPSHCSQVTGGGTRTDCGMVPVSRKSGIPTTPSIQTSGISSGMIRLCWWHFEWNTHAWSYDGGFTWWRDTKRLGGTDLHTTLQCGLRFKI